MSCGMGVWASAAILSSLGRTPSWEITCPRKSTRAAPIYAFYSEIVLSYEVGTEKKR